MVSNPKENHDFLERLRRQCSLDLMGVAELGQEREALAGLPESVRASLHTAVVIGIRVSRAVLSTLEDGPNLLYFHHYRQLNAHLDRSATIIAIEIERQGSSALPVPASQIVDWKQMCGQLSHNAIARLAGLGWRGRDNLMATPQLGSQVRLATILADFPSSPGHSLEADCGSCRRCIAVCPAQAIGETPAVFDSAACYHKLSEFRKTRNMPHHVCGMCVKACPGPDPIDGVEW